MVQISPGQKSLIGRVKWQGETSPGEGGRQKSCHRLVSFGPTGPTGQDVNDRIWFLAQLLLCVNIQQSVRLSISMTESDVWLNSSSVLTYSSPCDCLLAGRQWQNLIWLNSSSVLTYSSPCDCLLAGRQWQNLCVNIQQSVRLSIGRTSMTESDVWLNSSSVLTYSSPCDCLLAGRQWQNLIPGSTPPLC